MGFEWIGLDESQERLLCITSSVPCVNSGHNGQRAYNSSTAATPNILFDRRHREKVFLCVIYPAQAYE